MSLAAGPGRWAADFLATGHAGAVQRWFLPQASPGQLLTEPGMPLAAVLSVNAVPGQMVQP